jgi:CheY-like chemotaxis protein
MTKLRVAVLEDDAEVLGQLDRWLKSIENVEVVTATDNVIEFKKRVRTKAPDALLLDIEIGGDRYAGLDMAREFDLPVLFISGKTREDLLDIERIQRLRDHLPVEHLTKPYDEIDLRRAVNKLVRLIDATRDPTTVALRLPTRERLQVRLEEIVSIESPEEDGAGHNDRIIYFTDRRPVIVPKLSMTDAALEAEGFPKGALLRISKFSLVNPRRITRWSKASVWVECMMKDGKRGPRLLEVGAVYADAVEALLKSMF